MCHSFSNLIRDIEQNGLNREQAIADYHRQQLEGDKIRLSGNKDMIKSRLKTLKMLTEQNCKAVDALETFERSMPILIQLNEACRAGFMTDEAKQENFDAILVNPRVLRKFLRTEPLKTKVMSMAIEAKYNLGAACSYAGLNSIGLLSDENRNIINSHTEYALSLALVLERLMDCKIVNQENVGKLLKNITYSHTISRVFYVLERDSDSAPEVQQENFDKIINLIEHSDSIAKHVVKWGEGSRDRLILQSEFDKMINEMNKKQRQINIHEFLRGTHPKAGKDCVIHQFFGSHIGSKPGVQFPNHVLSDPRIIRNILKFV